jgi:hypothetical protein
MRRRNCFVFRFAPAGKAPPASRSPRPNIEKKQYEENGVTVPPSAGGTGGGTLKIKTEAPPMKHAPYFNERKGTVEQALEGAGPAFNWSTGKGYTKAATPKLHDAGQRYKTAAAQKPKKEYLTKKNGKRTSPRLTRR